MAFFSDLTKSLFNTSRLEENVMGSSSGSFINTSQTAQSVAVDMVYKMKSGKALSELPSNVNSPMSSTWLHQDATNQYVIPIDYTDLGDLSDNFLKVLNKYDNSYINDAVNTHSFYKDSDGKLKQVYTRTKIVPSLFNPYIGIRALGTNTNQPLIDVVDDDRQNQNSFNKNAPIPECDITDCSIWNLLKYSTKSDGKEDMGQSIYKLADFMYCKELGKVSNNHLITLRRYATPIGDNIFHDANTGDPLNLASCAPDIAHMVTWFGTEDNKLSNIIKMSFRATWKEMNSEIQQVDTQADSEGGGILGMIANTLNPAYNRSMNKGISGSHNLMSWVGSKFQKGGVNFGKPGQYQNNAALGNYDKHKIYEPKNTIQSNHYYEGKIVFEHEFSLTFNYKIRNYGDISQKAAMQDLINNILTTTFTKGSFWGGATKIVGAPGNNSGLRKMNAFIDETYDKLAGFAESVLTGSINWQELMGSLSSAVGNMMNAATDTAKEILGDPKGTAKKYGDQIIDFWKSKGLSQAAKGALKNALGRPALYAINSLVSGENLGLWHVTIGNPLNPILTIGNLILTNAELSFGDCPLGLEDFPTELKCVVTLKHCKPRDLVDISRMFTKGEGAIGLPLGQGGITNYYKNGQGYVKREETTDENGELKVIEVPNTNTNNLEGQSKDTYIADATYQQIYGTNVATSMEHNAASLT